VIEVKVKANSSLSGSPQSTSQFTSSPPHHSEERGLRRCWWRNKVLRLNPVARGRREEDDAAAHAVQVRARAARSTGGPGVRNDPPPGGAGFTAGKGQAEPSSIGSFFAGRFKGPSTDPTSFFDEWRPPMPAEPSSRMPKATALEAGFRRPCPVPFRSPTRDSF